MKSTKNIYLISDGVIGEGLLIHVIKDISEKILIFYSNFIKMKLKLVIFQIKYMSKISEIQKQKFLSNNASLSLKKKNLKINLNFKRGNIFVN